MGARRHIGWWTLLVMLGTVLTASPSSADVGNVGAWGDQGDGTYRNPILPGDYQNTDVVQVGADYYYISSNKSFSPGMLVLHSTDLVNWEPIGHVVPDLTAMSPRYGHAVMTGETRGTWAGSIYHHAGRFLVYFTSPDEGIYVSTATDPAGPWSPLTVLKAGPGWDDPAVLFDNGQAYLATTNFADGYTTYLYTLSPDGRRLTDAGTVILRGDGAEASKLYKINGFYYHFFSKVVGGVRNPYLQRATGIYGDGGRAGQAGRFELHQLLRSTGRDRQPNQGTLLQDAGGGWWFVTHQGVAGWEGRSASLLPVTWANGWPTAGADPDGDGIGEMVWGGRKPIAGGPRRWPQSSDDFTAATLRPQWEWYFQPRADAWSLTDRPGHLRLRAFVPLAAGNLKRSGNVLTLRTLNTASTVTVKLDTAHLADGQRAGLAVFGSRYRWAGVVQDAGVKRFAIDTDGTLTTGATAPTGTAYLRATWDNAAVARFFTSVDGVTFTRVGDDYPIVNFGNYIGARVGVFTYNDRAEAGDIDVDWVHAQYDNGPPA